MIPSDHGGTADEGGDQRLLSAGVGGRSAARGSSARLF